MIPFPIVQKTLSALIVIPRKFQENICTIFEMHPNEFLMQQTLQYLMLETQQ